MSKITGAELFAREREKQAAAYRERLAWEATTEGAAAREQQEAHHKRMAEADERYALEHPPEDEEDEEDEDSADDC